jgi:hypothetical protein
MLGRGAQKKGRENFSTFAGKKKSPSPPASRFIREKLFTQRNKESHTPLHKKATQQGRSKKIATKESQIESQEL